MFLVFDSIGRPRGLTVSPWSNEFITIEYATLTVMTVSSTSTDSVLRSVPVRSVVTLFVVDVYFIKPVFALFLPSFRTLHL